MRTATDLGEGELLDVWRHGRGARHVAVAGGSRFRPEDRTRARGWKMKLGSQPKILKIGDEKISRDKMDQGGPGKEGGTGDHCRERAVIL